MNKKKERMQNMIFKDTQTYESYHANNNDEYGKAILDFAERWAELLEKRIVNNFEDSVENTIEKYACILT